MKKIYYIEDDPEEFEIITSRLSDRFEMYPGNEHWYKEMEAIKLYLQNPKEEYRQEIEEFLKKSHADLFIIDLKLFHAIGGGLTIYEQILMPREEFNHKKYIFMSSLTSANIVVTKSVGWVPKVVGESGKVDFDKTSKKLYMEIDYLLGTRNSVLDSLNKRI